jgi:hypothetical protein
MQILLLSVLFLCFALQAVTAKTDVAMNSFESLATTSGAHLFADILSLVHFSIDFLFSSNCHSHKNANHTAIIASNSCAELYSHQDANFDANSTTCGCGVHYAWATQSSSDCHAHEYKHPISVAHCRTVDSHAVDHAISVAHCWAVDTYAVFDAFHSSICEAFIRSIGCPDCSAQHCVHSIAHSDANSTTFGCGLRHSRATICGPNSLADDGAEHSDPHGHPVRRVESALSQAYSRPSCGSGRRNAESISQSA